MPQGYQANEDKEPEKMEHLHRQTVEAMSCGAVPVVIIKADKKRPFVRVSMVFGGIQRKIVVGKDKDSLLENDALRKQFASRSVDFAKNPFHRKIQ